MDRYKEFLDDEDGQGMIEYAMIIGAISIAAIVILSMVGKKLASKFESVNEDI